MLLSCLADADHSDTARHYGKYPAEEKLPSLRAEERLRQLDKEIRKFKTDSERNRLRADMQLGIDASILYVHQDHDGAPTAEMLKEKSPYNTRVYKGLPPTPICNPGLMSIIAALNPSQTDYYYYALDTETGRHRFFNDENEFNAFVATQDY